MSERTWLCRCACGREIYVCEYCLLSGRVTSCGECDDDGGKMLPIINERSPKEKVQ
jgi:hypothetical protein